MGMAKLVAGEHVFQNPTALGKIAEETVITARALSSGENQS
jgi:hypothetical protein